MPEQKIVVMIDENGKITASTEGIKGEMCLKELEDLIGNLAEIESFTKTDEFYQSNELKRENIIKRSLK